jgi:hypothetical protein
LENYVQVDLFNALRNAFGVIALLYDIWFCVVQPAKDKKGYRYAAYAALLFALLWAAVILKSYAYAGYIPVVAAAIFAIIALAYESYSIGKRNGLRELSTQILGKDRELAKSRDMIQGYTAQLEALTRDEEHLAPFRDLVSTAKQLQARRQEL